MTRFIRRFGIGVLVLFCGLQQLQADDRSLSVSELNVLLSRAAAYEYGKDRAVFNRIDSLIQWALRDPGRIKAVENSLIRFLESESTQAGKAFVCQKLSVVGTDRSVPVLARMLKNEATFDMALFALERNPDSRALAAMRKELTKATGKQKIGLIHALGHRKDEKSVAELDALAGDRNADIARTAVVALGDIANPEATSILWNLLPKAETSLKVQTLHSLLRCAVQARIQGRIAEASSIQEALMGSQYPATIRRAALIGMCETHPEKIQSIILNALQRNDSELKTTAIQQIRYAKDASFFKTLAEMLPLQDPAHQIQLMAAFSDVKARDVLEAITGQIESIDPDVQKEAIRAIGCLGDAGSVKRLIAIAAESNALREAARQALDMLPGRSVDSVLVRSLLFAENGPVKIELIRSIGERRIAGAADPLSSYVSDPNPAVRLEAIRASGQIASPDRMQALIDILAQTKNPQEQTESKKAVVAIAQRISDPDFQVKTVLLNADTAPNTPLKAAFVEVLGKIGNPIGLPYIRNALNDPDVDLQKAAISALSAWPTADPIQQLRDFSGSAKDEQLRMLALRGYVRMIDISTLADEEKADRFREAFQSSTEWQIQRTILSNLSNLDCLSAFHLLAEGLEIPALKPDAENRILRWAGRYFEKDPAAVSMAMQKIAATSDNPDNVRSAKAWLVRMGGETK